MKTILKSQEQQITKKLYIYFLVSLDSDKLNNTAKKKIVIWIMKGELRSPLSQ